MVERASADDLLVLLEVNRTGRFTRAAENLGVNHTTIARRIESLERRLGGRVLVRSTSGWELTPLGRRAVAAAEEVDMIMSALSADDEQEELLEDVVRISTPDAFAIFVAAPAAARLRQKHPQVAIEIISAPRRATVQRSGLDVEVVVGEPNVLRAEAHCLATYVLQLYASEQYVASHGLPSAVSELDTHGLVYFIPSMLQLDSLDVGRQLVPTMRDAVTSTNVMAHIAAVRAGAGIGLLPTFLAARHSDLVPVLADDIVMPLDYWLVTRHDTMRRPAVAALVNTLSTMIDSGKRLQ